MPQGEGNEPTQIQPQKLGDYLDVMSKAIFQSGISWKVVENKWPGTREVFRDFDIDKVANLSPNEVDEIAKDTRVIRNRRKIEAIIGNANRMIELENEHGSFRKYLRSHADFDATLASVKKNFKFMGNMGIYYFLYVVGEDVPSHEEFMACQKTG